MLPATAEERSDLQPMRMEQASRAAPSEDIAYVVVNQHEDATEGVPLMIPDTSDFAKVTVKTDAEENIVNVCGLRMKRRQRTLLVASLLTLIGTCWFAVEVSSFKSGNGLTTKASPPSADGSGGPSLTDKFKSLMQAGFSFLGNAFKPTETDVYGKPLIYDPQIYPWARDVESFLNKLDKGIEVIKAKRQAIWDKHQPVAEAFLVGDLDTFNEGQVVKDMAKATLEQSTYRIGVMGTSVTAGHDNYFWQSYPIVWGAHMQESFDSLGINFTVVNSAMGWNPLNPSYYCQGELIGEGANIVVWEYSMMGGTDTEHEVWIRNGLQMPNQPHLLFLDPGTISRDRGSPERIDAKPSFDWISEPARDYSAFGFSFAFQKLDRALYNVDHLEKYDHTAIFEHKVDERASWHPGPWGHELRADVLAYDYLDFLAQAVEGVYDAVSQRETNFTSLLPVRNIPFPEPMLCPPDLCRTRPTCVTTYQNRVGPSLLDYVTFPAEIPFVEDLNLAASNTAKGWHQQLYFTDVPAIQRVGPTGMNLGYLDRKYVIQGTNEDGPIRFEFDTKTENYIIMCAAIANNAALCPNSIWTIDGEIVECGTEDRAHEHGNPAPHDSCMITLKKYPPGHHVWEIEMMKELPDPEHPFVAIAHLIFW